MGKKSAIGILLALTLILAVVPGIGATTEAPEADVPQATTGFVDIATQGTGWVVQRTGKFKVNKPYGWGVRTKAKAATQEWVHIPLNYTTFLDGTAMKLSKVEFCAQSTNPTQTKPVRMDVWANNKRISSVNISWPNSTGIVCKWIDYPSPKWYEAIGISVLVKYANSTDRVTLYKAWLRLVP